MFLSQLFDIKNPMWLWPSKIHEIEIDCQKKNDKTIFKTVSRQDHLFIPVE